MLTTPFIYEKVENTVIKKKMLFARKLPKFLSYLDFSHLTELKNIYINEIYMKKQDKSSRTKNHEIKQKKNFF